MKESKLKVVAGVVILVAFLLFPLVVVSQTKSKQAGAAPAPPGNPTQGQQIFQRECVLCHFPDSAANKIGPGLKGLFKNKQLPVSKKPTSVANIQMQIEKGNPAKGMPAFAGKLSKTQISDLLAYLKTL